MPQPKELRLLHEAALNSLYALVRFHDLVLRYAQLPPERRTGLPPEELCHQFVLPFARGLQLMIESHEPVSSPEQKSAMERMTAARLSLGRPPLVLQGMAASSAHQHVFGVSILLIRLWNRHACPAEIESRPATLSGPLQLALHAPQKDMNADPFLSDSYHVLDNYNPMLLHVELDLEYTKSDETLRQEPILPTIWHHGDRAYSRDQVISFAVTPDEDNILQTFLESGRAMETRDLTNKSGVTNVSRTIGALREKYDGVFADAIRTPPEGKKGTGGYFIRVLNSGS